MLKLKQQYRDSYELKYTWKDQSVKYYPYLRSYIFKNFSTKQEKSAYNLHSIEYRHYLVKIRVARGKALPDPYNDYTACVYKLAKSWKHNSKRRHQYLLP